MKKASKGTLVTGVIGSDTHIVGNRILSRALEQAGFEVVALGALTPASEFVDAAIETNADAIWVAIWWWASNPGTASSGDFWTWASIGYLRRAHGRMMSSARSPMTLPHAARLRS